MRKLGERVLPEIIPILEKGLDSDEADQRQGVCIGLSEIMGSTSREHVSWGGWGIAQCKWDGMGAVLIAIVYVMVYVNSTVQVGRNGGCADCCCVCHGVCE